MTGARLCAATSGTTWQNAVDPATPTPWVHILEGCGRCFPAPLQEPREGLPQAAGRAPGHKHPVQGARGQAKCERFLWSAPWARVPGTPGRSAPAILTLVNRNWRQPRSVCSATPWEAVWLWKCVSAAWAHTHEATRTVLVPDHSVRFYVTTCKTWKATPDAYTWGKNHKAQALKCSARRSAVASGRDRGWAWRGPVAFQAPVGPCIAAAVSLPPLAPHLHTKCSPERVRPCVRFFFCILIALLRYIEIYLHIYC